MTSTRSILRSGIPWLLLAPVLVLAGVGLGRWLPPTQGSSQTQWRVDQNSDRSAGPQIPAEVAQSAALRQRQVGMPSLAPIVARVGAGVVGIRTIHKLTGERERSEAGLAGAARASGPEELQASSGVTLGTGFLIHRDGLILTALHVVADPMVIVVRIQGHRQIQAELIGEDPTTDLAVIRLIAPPDDLKVLEFGDSESVLQGDWVMTVGNPLNFEHSVGFGIVSHLARHIQADGFGITNGYLQFTAPSNPGSSGSPVFDMNGEVVGIATRGALSAQGLSFAIPTRDVRQVLRAMERNGGHVRRAYVGIAFETLEPAAAETASESSPDFKEAAPFKEAAGGRVIPSGGVLVSGVTPGDPAHQAGLRKGDVIVAFDGSPIVGSQDLYDRITWSVPATKVQFSVVREGKRIEPLEVELGEIGEPVSSDPTH